MKLLHILPVQTLLFSKILITILLFKFKIEIMPNHFIQINLKIIIQIYWMGHLKKEKKTVSHLLIISNNGYNRIDGKQIYYLNRLVNNDMPE